MHAVGYHGSTVVGIHLQKFGSKEDAGVAQRLAYRVQHKGGGERILIGYLDDLFLQRGDGVRQMNIQRVVAVEQAVWHDFHLNLLHHRWQSAQGLNKPGVAVNLIVKAADDVVIWSAVHVEGFIVGRHLFQGVGQVKRHLLLLRIE